jgi:hypothetical protein
MWCDSCCCCRIDRDRKCLVLVRSCATLGDVGACSGAVSPLANELCDEREGSAQSVLKPSLLLAPRYRERSVS